jgi:predicted transcriptional regulator
MPPKAKPVIKGRPVLFPGDVMRTFTLRLPDSLARRLGQYGSAHNLAQADVVRAALTRYLSEEKPALSKQL